jgi:hypothetical protein
MNTATTNPYPNVARHPAPDDMPWASGPALSRFLANSSEIAVLPLSRRQEARRRMALCLPPPISLKPTSSDTLPRI